MALLTRETYQKADIFSWLKILQHTSRLFGMSFDHGFGLNLDSLISTVVIMCYGGCLLGVKLCSKECCPRGFQKEIVVLMLGIRITQLGMIVCIVKFHLSNVHVNLMLHLSKGLTQHAGFTSFKYRRRNVVITTLFLAWIVTKIIQLMYIVVDETRTSDQMRFYSACAFLNSWQLMILNWQFLVWMQIFSRALKTSLDELRAIVDSQERPFAKHEVHISEFITRVKLVLQLKRKILRVYGISVVFNQLQASVWILMYVVGYFFRKHNSRLIRLSWKFALNVSVFCLPLWIGQEISSESTEMLYEVLRWQVTKKRLMIDKKLSNFLFGILHENPKFTICNLFNLDHRQILSFLSLSFCYLINQLQLIH